MLQAETCFKENELIFRHQEEAFVSTMQSLYDIIMILFLYLCEKILNYGNGNDNRPSGQGVEEGV